MAHIVTLYNNKGGVSKTTTAYSLAAFLSTRGRVLLVDFDPQCNATELFLAPTGMLEQPDAELVGTSVYQALKPRFQGDTGSIDPRTVTLVNSSVYPNLMLFRGDLEFSEAENYLSTALGQAITENVNEKKTYVVIPNLLRALAAMHELKYIICDVGPSTGAIPRMVVLSSDGILIPVTPDRFSNQAVTVLGTIIRKWIARHSQIASTLEPFGVKSFDGTPVLYGSIIQNFKVYGGKIKPAYQRWQQKIADNIAEKLLGPEGIKPGPRCDPQSPFVATIPDLGPLVPIAQTFGRALYDVQQSHTAEASASGSMYYGVAWQAWQEKMSQYKQQISKIADALP
jgi:chromosome partitioning protein